MITLDELVSKEVFESKLNEEAAQLSSEIEERLLDAPDGVSVHQVIVDCFHDGLVFDTVFREESLVYLDHDKALPGRMQSIREDLFKADGLDDMQSTIAYQKYVRELYERVCDNFSGVTPDDGVKPTANGAD